MNVARTAVSHFKSKHTQTRSILNYSIAVLIWLAPMEWRIRRTVLCSDVTTNIEPNEAPGISRRFALSQSECEFCVTSHNFHEVLHQVLPGDSVTSSRHGRLRAWCCMVPAKKLDCQGQCAVNVSRFSSILAGPLKGARSSRAAYTIGNSIVLWLFELPIIELRRIICTVLFGPSCEPEHDDGADIW